MPNVDFLNQFLFGFYFNLCIALPKGDVKILAITKVNNDLDRNSKRNRISRNLMLVVNTENKLASYTTYSVESLKLKLHLEFHFNRASMLSILSAT